MAAINKTAIDRRRFLKGSSMLVAGSATFSMIGCASLSDYNSSSPRANSVDTGLTKQEWNELDQIQQHLLPSEEHAPGAKEVNARAYFQWVLSDPDYDHSDRKFIKTGLTALTALCLKQHKVTFSQLPFAERESILRDFEKTKDGYAWLTTVMNYLLESLLTDPIYGGNPNGIGWKWLQHTPGFPRPTIKYTEL